MKGLSLGKRVYLLTTLGLLGAMTISLLFSYRSFEAMMKERFEEKMRFLARHLTSSALLALAFRDEKTLERLARGVLEEEEVTGVEIRDASGKLLVRVGKPSPEDLVLRRRVVSRVPEEGLVFGGMAGPQVLGHIFIYYSTASFEARMRALLLKSLLAGLFFFLLVDLALYFLVSRAVSAPLRSLLRGVQEVQEGKLEFRPLAVSLPEVRELSEAFAAMVDSLRASRRELARSYEEMARNRTLAEVGRLSLLIAHEIKNPLGIIKGAIDILRKEEVPPEIRAEMISYIEEELSRIDNLVKSFLTFARPKKLRFERIDLRQVIEMAARKLSLGEKAPAFHLEIEEDLPFRGDPQWLEQVFFNLFTNAFEAGAKNIRVRARRDGDGLVVEIRDDGPGIPEEKREEVFKPFYTEKTRGGMGLGLAIVEQIVRLHGGEISLENHPEGGALFRIRFPVEEQGQ